MVISKDKFIPLILNETSNIIDNRNFFLAFFTNGYGIRDILEWSAHRRSFIYTYKKDIEGLLVVIL